MHGKEGARIDTPVLPTPGVVCTTSAVQVRMLIIHHSVSPGWADLATSELI